MPVPQPYMYAGKWSDWKLDGSGLRFYRGRDVSWDFAQAVESSPRSSIVTNEYGSIQYEFAGRNDRLQDRVTADFQYIAPSSPVAYPAEVTYGAFQYPQQTSNPQPVLQPPELFDNDDSVSGVSGHSASGSEEPHRTLINVDPTRNGLKISFPEVSDEHVIVRDRRSRRRHESERKPRGNYRVREDYWLGGN